MQSFFASGRAIDLILFMVIIEFAVLAAVQVRTGRGVPPRRLIANLVAGFLLLATVREALVGAPWPILSTCLIGALLAHLADLGQRWRALPRRPTLTLLPRREGPSSAPVQSIRKSARSTE